MLVLVRRRVCVFSILKLQEIRLREIHAPAIQCGSILLLIRLTHHEVDMVQTDGAVVGQCILYQGISIFAMSLLKAFILLG